jgi:hypothetical protein
MRWLGVAVVMGGLLGLGLSGPSRAQGKKMSDEERDAEVVKNLALADEMAAVGRDKAVPAPEALIAAASLLLKVNAMTGGELGKLEGKDKATVVGGTGEPGEATKGKKLDVKAEKSKSLKEQAEELFQAARDLGGPGVVQMIKAARARNFDAVKDKFAKRGALGGPRRGTYTVPGNNYHHFTIWFEANQPAVIAVRSAEFVRFRVRLPNSAGRLEEVVNNPVMAGHYMWYPRKRVAATVYIQGTGKNATYTISTN